MSTHEKVTLTLDMSTAATGWAVFVNEELEEYDVIKPKVKGISNLPSPWSAIAKSISMGEQIVEIIEEYDPDEIIIEEINGGAGRLSQKSLSGMHFLVLYAICQYYDKNIIPHLYYIDSDGKDGWRKRLNLTLSDEDKAYNKEVAAEVKRAKTKALKNKAKEKKRNKKDLACRFVNHVLGLNLDHRVNPTDADIADAIGIGLGWFRPSLITDK